MSCPEDDGHDDDCWGHVSRIRHQRSQPQRHRPTLDAVAAAGLLEDIGTLLLERGYDYPVVRSRLAALGIDDVDIQRRDTKQPQPPTPMRHGLRWIVESTNSRLANYGQLRRNTEERRTSGGRVFRYRVASFVELLKEHDQR